MLITGSGLMGSLETRALHQRQRSCQRGKENKLGFFYFKKKGISTAMEVESTTQGLQYFIFFLSISIKSTHLKNFLNT